VNETALPPIVKLLSVPLGPLVGSIAVKFRAPAACVMVKLNVLEFQDSEPNDEEFLPSSHVSSCSDEMMGTFWLFAELRMLGPIPG
jgi:hypothetical protein